MNTVKNYFVIIFSVLILLSPAPQIFAQMPDEKLSTEKLKLLEAAVANKEYEKLSSVVISKNGQLVYEKYYGGFNENSLHDTRSATKTITGILIGIAIDKGFIKSEKQTIAAFFADKKPFENADPRKAKITIEDLLTMSSGLECDDDNQFSRGNEERMYLIEDYFKFFLDLPFRGKAPWEDETKDLPYQRRFGYCTAGTVLLGGILERATKTKVTDFAEKNLFAPLGISGYKWQFTPMGTAMTGGGLRLKSRDFIKIGSLFLTGGKYGDQQIIPQSWVEKSVSPKVNAREDADYAYLWWLPKTEYQGEKYAALAMFGNGGNKIIVLPKLNAVVVLTNRLYGQNLGHRQTEKIFSEYILPFLIENSIK